MSAVDVFNRRENSSHVLKRVREESRKRTHAIGAGLKETICDRELERLYSVFFPRLLPKLKASKIGTLGASSTRE